MAPKPTSVASGNISASAVKRQSAGRLDTLVAQVSSLVKSQTRLQELAYAVKSPSIIYASVQMEAGEIWQSTDDGKTYAKRRGLGPDGVPANYLGDQGWYDNSIWAGDPSDATVRSDVAAGRIAGRRSR